MSYKKSTNLSSILQHASHQRSLIFSLLIIAALIAFEIFNYSTTDFAMSDLLGDLKFGGVRWATILAVAFCGIDFAGIARLFTPESGSDEAHEAWYLFGAWLLAATMNAVLTWWGVSIAILQHQSLGNAVIPRDTLLKAVPVFVALMVWLSRVLIIGTFSVAGVRLFGAAPPSFVPLPAQTRSSFRNRAPKPSTRPRTPTPVRRTPTSFPQHRPVQASSFSPKPKPSHPESGDHSAGNSEATRDPQTKHFF